MRQVHAGMIGAAMLQGAAIAAPPIEAYGELPEISDVSISPDGQHFAYLSHKDGEVYFAVTEVGGAAVAAAKTGDLKARNVWFASNDHAVLIASETASDFRFRGAWEQSGAFAFNLKTKKMQLLMRGTEGLFPAQSGLGAIVGRLAGTDKVFMPAYMGSAAVDPSYDLLRVDLNSGRGIVAARGRHATIDWFVDTDGTVLAREDFDDDENAYSIFMRRNDKLEAIYEEKNVAIPTFGVRGVSEDRASLIISSRPEGSQFYRLARMTGDGALSPPIFVSRGKETEQVIVDGNRVVLGVRYSGMVPSYEFTDPEMTAAVANVAGYFPDGVTYLVDWSEDRSRLIFLVEGGNAAPAYYLLNRDRNSIAKIASQYARIEDKDIGPVTTIEYKARDGRKIPSVITRPPGTDLGATLPLIVLPHGGPEAYDAVGFDWIAQYFANRGYLVLQPNFRGSDGFGAEHRQAGYGEWGGRMQDDLTDGVNLLVKYKWADPDRVCIIGGSYGGYAALAGGAYTPELYKCVAAIAPVSDLAMFLAQRRRDGGADSFIFDYWTKLIGDRSKDKAKIEAISPVNAAANFTAPVLLLHGIDDTVVPIAHSTKMEAALKKAGKSVRLVKLKGEDHWLSVSETRLQTLIELDKFVTETIGAKQR